MTWTSDEIEKIPEVYRDFLLLLRQDDSAEARNWQPQSQTVVGWVSLASMFNALRLKYQYSPRQVRAVAENLKKAGLIEEKSDGYIRPTEKGHELAGALLEDGLRRELASVPPFPTL